MTPDRLADIFTITTINMGEVHHVERDQTPPTGCEQLRATMHDDEQFIITIRKVARPKSRAERFREGPPW